MSWAAAQGTEEEGTKEGRESKNNVNLHNEKRVIDFKVW